MFGILGIDYILGLVLLGFLIAFLVDVMYRYRNSERKGLSEISNLTRKNSTSTPGVKDKLNNDWKQRQESFITTYEFPPALLKKVHQAYPHIHSKDSTLILTGLREFFLICLDAEMKPVSMPSQVVDVAWHEFILSTQAYEEFCQNAFGRFLHHMPAEAMQGTEYASEGIKRIWALTCKREGIDPKAPTQLPLLFALDAKLDIGDGYKYSLDCRQPGSYPYCAMHIGEIWLPTYSDSTIASYHDSGLQVGSGCGGMFDGWFGGGSGCSSGGGCSGGCGGGD
jgi:hypothetical protein